MAAVAATATRVAAAGQMEADEAEWQAASAWPH